LLRAEAVEGHGRFAELLTLDSGRLICDHWELGIPPQRRDPTVDAFSVIDCTDSSVEALARAVAAAALLFEGRGDGCSPTATTGVKASGLSLALLLLHGSHLMLRCGAATGVKASGPSLALLLRHGNHVMR